MNHLTVHYVIIKSVLQVLITRRQPNYLADWGIINLIWQKLAIWLLETRIIIYALNAGANYTYTVGMRHNWLALPLLLNDLKPITTNHAYLIGLPNYNINIIKLKNFLQITCRALLFSWNRIPIHLHMFGNKQISTQIKRVVNYLHCHLGHKRIQLCCWFLI